MRVSDVSVTTLAGGLYSGYADGTDGSLLYVADRSNSMLRMVVATLVETYVQP